jgi:2-oxoglutarate dehydrogenase E2 component (dihydrolipoamide succinyltransferase)
MPTKVIVPQLGEGVEEVTIVNWLKSEGDNIEEYDGLVEVETDKVVTEIPSPASGIVLKILEPNAGSMVPVGDILAWVGSSGEDIPASGTDSPETEKETQAEPPPPSSVEPVQVSEVTEKSQPQFAPAPGRDANLGFISPVVARIAAENKLDLSQIEGTGLHGRITKKDVLVYLETGKPSAQPPSQTAIKPEASQPVSTLTPGQLVPHSTVRRRIAEHMVMSKRTSAHVTTLMEADMSRVTSHRQAHKVAFQEDGTRLTFTAYFVSATIAALKAYPLVNTSWTDEGLLMHSQINIGMATDLGEDGLIVPVIKNADELSLLGIARSVNDLAIRARSKKLSPADVQDATFSITNHGVSGSLLATPIINQPQCAILGVGTIEKRVVVVPDEHGNDTIGVRPRVYLTLTFDHRILDGAAADHFLAKVVEILETWPVE